MKIAIVHDWLTNMGGAERIIRILHQLFPDAPIYTIVYNKNNMPKDFEKMDIRPSFIQNMPFGVKKYQSYLPLMPIAVENFDLSEYDVILSSSTACAKGVITRSDTVHICYCNTPMRYAWDMYHDYVRDKGTFVRGIISLLMNYIRLWDRVSADRVDYFIANSNNVANRIQKHYKRESSVIYPPVDTDFYTPIDENEDYYLIVSRLVPYKKIDLAIEVFNDMELPLVIIGDGSELDKYKSIAKENIRFLGRLKDKEVRDYYRRCRAFIFPGEEDFGITPVEAQACGRPVIAYGKGGALETIIDKKTGVFFKDQSVQALKEAVMYLEDYADQFNKEIIRNHAFKFSTKRFEEEMVRLIDEKTKGALSS
ncbi:glycosyltransferase family 4 protein [Anaerophilus nitritogenes]|uniref:glycosyltransferase family 4 protein n=1 Tax=Anaerophilus nitritogenes TaxID=2498136 RepID=UPI00101CF9FC|nr:glycosyltransferase family 4 protein [Anaerophilus nitritogenes]